MPRRSPVQLRFRSYPTLSKGVCPIRTLRDPQSVSPATDLFLRRATSMEIVVPPECLPPGYIPPVDFGPYCVEFEALQLARNGRHGTHLNHHPLGGPPAALRHVLFIDSVAVAYVNAKENHTLHIIPLDRKRNDGYIETPRFSFGHPISKLLNLTNGIPRVAAILTDGTIQLLVRMRMLPWLLGESIKPAIPRIDFGTLSVRYCAEFNSLLWLFRRADPKGSRGKGRDMYELWVYHMNWPAELLSRERRRAEYLLADGLPGPGSIVAFGQCLALFFGDCVVWLESEDLRLYPLPTEDLLKERNVPSARVWQPDEAQFGLSGSLHAVLEKRSANGFPLRSVFHNASMNAAHAIYGDVLYQFIATHKGIFPAPIYSLARFDIPISLSPTRLKFFYDEKTNTLVLHDGAHLCVVNRRLRSFCDYVYKAFYREFAGTLVPSDTSPTALFRMIGGPPVFVKSMPTHMLKIPPFVQRLLGEQYQMFNM